MAADLEALTARLLDAAKAAGAEAADAIAVAGDSLSIEVRNGALEQAERAEGDRPRAAGADRPAAGLRVVERHPRRRRSPRWPSGRSRWRARRRRIPGAGWPRRRSWRAAGTPAALDLVDPAPMPLGGRELQAAALAAEAAALAVPGVSKIDAAGAGWSASRMHLAATQRLLRRLRPHRALRCRRWRSAARARRWSATTPSRAACTAPTCPARTRSAGWPASGPRRGPAPAKPPTGAFPVLYDERVASGLIGHLVQAINGTAIARGASWLKDALGERVLPAGIDLVEDPLRPRIAGSRPFDGEGLPVARRRAGRRRRAAGLDARPRHRAAARDAEHRQRRRAAPRRRRARRRATWR